MIEIDSRINKIVSDDGKKHTFIPEKDAIAALKNIRASDTDGIKENNHHENTRSILLVASMIASGFEQELG